MADSGLKALTEIDLLKEHQITVPNSTFDPTTCFSKNSDSLSPILMKEVRVKFSQNLTNGVNPVFFNISHRKTPGRMAVS